jgi:hypothetical protein
MAVAALACVSGIASAGPNDGGTILVHDANAVYTTDNATYCGLGLGLQACGQADVVLEGSENVAMVWKVYAAFRDGSAPRLKGMTWGISYPGSVVLAAYGPCIGDPNNGAAEFPGAGWPNSNTGTSLVWQNTQTSLLVEAYWFAGYSYYGEAGLFQLQAHADPVLGGKFGDDSIPSVQDPIAGFGSMGFNTPGVVACPGTQEPTGACCIGQDCRITTERECPGTYQGDNVPCDPNPCLVFGACCVGQDCFVVTADECAAMGGTYLGDNLVCDPNPCLIFGACCFGPECVVLTETDCAGQGGAYQGDNTLCDPNPCQQNPTEQTSWGQIKANYR